ncbi:hypothetical protein BH11BAC5_BH11BAC5_49760 [soil metagenome]
MLLIICTIKLENFFTVSLKIKSEYILIMWCKKVLTKSIY